MKNFPAIDQTQVSRAKNLTDSARLPAGKVEFQIGTYVEQETEPTAQLWVAGGNQLSFSRKRGCLFPKVGLHFYGSRAGRIECGV